MDGAVFFWFGSKIIGPGSIPAFNSCSLTINLNSEFVSVICGSKILSVDLNLVAVSWKRNYHLKVLKIV